MRGRDVVAHLARGPRGARARCRRARGRACGRRRRDGRSRRRSRARSAPRRRSTVLIVSIECGASPERMLARLAPSACSRPRPSEWRRSSSSASRGWLVTIAAPRSFSHQRNAGMSSLLPCRRPAWQAPVCEDQSVSHRAAGASPRAASARGWGRCRRAARGAARRGRARRSRGRRCRGPRCATVCSRRRSWRRDDVAVPGVVLVDRQQRVDERGDRRHRDRHHDPLEDPVDLGARQDVDREGDEHAVEHERGAAEGEDGERQREAREQRPDQRVEERRSAPPRRARRRRHRGRSRPAAARAAAA